jgi:tRNA1Val (adenine37-N6)-methyltransferase
METTLDSIRDIQIHQSRNGYRFSIDALLLYSFVNLPTVKRIADLGSGSGIVGILLAKKYSQSQVILLELQETLVNLAVKNVKQNRLEERVTVVGCDIRKLGDRDTEGQILPGSSVDLVVSNPPFRRPKAGLISPEEEKAIARHEIKLGLPELISAARFLLRAKGRFVLIYHPSRLSELAETVKGKGMEIKRLRFVHSHAASEAKMVLVEAVKDGRRGIKVEKPMYIYHANGGYTEEVRELCSGTSK